MSTNPDEAVGMADEPQQPPGAGESVGAADEGAGGAPDQGAGAGLGAGEPNTFEPEEGLEE